MVEKKRCEWVTDDPLYIAYHDEEWGVPVYDDQKLFEFLILEGAQAGLSWITILKRREAYREACDGFDPEKIALYDEKKVTELLANPGIIRNQLKIRSMIRNAQAFLQVQKSEPGGFSAYLWNFVGGQPIVSNWQSIKEVPAQTLLSQKLSKDLKKKGFGFVGPVICYAFMQAVGLVNDHTKNCFLSSS